MKLGRKKWKFPDSLSSLGLQLPAKDDQQTWKVNGGMAAIILAEVRRKPILFVKFF